MDYLIWISLFVLTWPLAGVFTGWFARGVYRKTGLVVVHAHSGNPLDWWAMGWIVFLEMIIGAPALLWFQLSEKVLTTKNQNGDPDSDTDPKNHES